MTAPMPGWLRDILVMATSEYDVSATLAEAGHALNAGDVTADDLIQWARQIRGDVMTAMIQANVDEEIALQPSDVAPVVWRVNVAPEGNQYTLGQLYRHAGGHWQVWLTKTQRWVISLAYGGLAEMLDDGYTLVPDSDPVPAVSEQEATD